MTANYQVMPALSAAEFAELKASIAERGVLVPVEYDEAGAILDGYHRVQACQELGIKDWPSIVRVGMDEAEKRAHARRLNLVRRHLNQEQKRALIAEQIRDTPERSARQIASALGVDHHTVSAQKASMESAGEIPQLTTCLGADGKVYPRQVERRPTVIAKSQREARATFDALAQMDTDTLPDKALDAKRVGRLAREYQASQRAKETAHDVGHGIARLLLGDFRERGQELEGRSVDLIFTDPPYPREFLPLWSDLSAFAARVLKPDGLMIAYTGALDLPEVIARLSEHMQYWWCGSIVLDGQHSRVYARNVVQGCKPLLFFVPPGGKPAAWIEDTYRSEGEQKDAHEWQQSLGAALYYIGKLSPADGLVVDPFLGGGTTGVAAKRLGRQFVGIEVEPVAFSSAEERIRNE